MFLGDSNESQRVSNAEASSWNNLVDCELGLPYLSCDFYRGNCMPFSTKALSTDSMTVQDRNQTNWLLYPCLPSVVPTDKRLITKETQKGELVLPVAICAESEGNQFHLRN
jgi:hypothetical protein